MSKEFIARIAQDLTYLEVNTIVAKYGITATKMRSPRHALIRIAKLYRRTLRHTHKQLFKDKEFDVRLDLFEMDMENFLVFAKQQETRERFKEKNFPLPQKTEIEARENRWLVAGKKQKYCAIAIDNNLVRVYRKPLLGSMYFIDDCFETTIKKDFTEREIQRVFKQKKHPLSEEVKIKKENRTWIVEDIEQNYFIITIGKNKVRVYKEKKNDEFPSFLTENYFDIEREDFCILLKQPYEKIREAFAQNNCPLSQKVEIKTNKKGSHIVDEKQQIKYYIAKANDNKVRVYKGEKRLHFGGFYSFIRIGQEVQKLMDESKKRHIADISLLYRLEDSTNQIIGIFEALQERHKKKLWTKFLEAIKTKQEKSIYHCDIDNNYTFREIEKKYPAFPLSPEEVILIKKIWEIGMEEIAFQTIVQLDGDVVTRIHPHHLDQNEFLYNIHNKSVGISIQFWKELVNIVKSFFETIVNFILKR